MIVSKTRQVFAIISRVSLLFIVLGGVIFSLIFFNNFDPAYDLGGLLIVGLLGVITLVLVLFSTLSKKQHKLKTQEVPYFFKIFLLLVFVMLFTSSYGLYGFWNLILGFITPTYLIGIVFLFALVLSVFFKDLNFALILGIPILLYPFRFIDHSKEIFALGAIVSGFIIGNIIGLYLQIGNNLKEEDRALTKKVLYSSLKIFVLTFAVALTLYFVLGNDSSAIFVSTIQIETNKMLINLTPFLLLLLLIIFQINYLISFFAVIILQTVMGFALDLFATSSEYNLISFLLYSPGFFGFVNLNLYLYSYCCAIIIFCIVLVLLSFKTMFQNLMDNSFLRSTLKTEVTIISRMESYRYWMTFYQRNWYDLFCYNSEDNIVLIELFSEEKIGSDDHFVSSVLLSQYYQKAFGCMLPFSVSLLWSIFWNSSISSISLASSYQSFLEGIWGVYLIIGLVSLFVMFPSLQNLFFSNWFELVFKRERLNEIPKKTKVKYKRIPKKIRSKWKW